MQKVSLLCFVAVFLSSGCATRTTSTANGNVVNEVYTDDIYQAKVALCSPFMPTLFDEVTQFVGNDRTSSPDKRRAEKEEAWKTWNLEVAEVKKEIQGKLFRVELPALFGNYDTTRNRMVLLKHSFTNEGISTFYKVDGGIPQELLYNSKSGSIFANPQPPSIPAEEKAKWGYRNFGKPSFADKDIYVINQSFTSSHWSSSNGGRWSTTGVREGSAKEYHDAILGVLIATNLWTSNPQSPIYREGNYTYLDVSKFDFVDSFGVYPDTGNVAVNVEYIFEMTDCMASLLNGKLKEVVISVKPIPGVISSKKQIGRVIL